MNEFSSVLQLYKKDLAKNCAADDNGEVYEAKEFLDEYEWIMVSQLDAALRHVGPFIATMEASESVSSLKRLRKSPCITPPAENNLSAHPDVAGTTSNCLAILDKLGHIVLRDFHQPRRSKAIMKGTCDSKKYSSTSLF